MLHEKRGARRKRGWTPAEVAYLRREWGTLWPHMIAINLSRSPVAILSKAKGLGLGDPNQGRESLRALARRSGYAISTLQKAAACAGVHLHRYFRRSVGGTRHNRQLGRLSSWYSVDGAAADALLDYLAALPGGMLPRIAGGKGVQGAWGDGAKPLACLLCGAFERPHRQNGYCVDCDGRGRGFWGVHGRPSRCKSCRRNCVVHYCQGRCKVCHERRRARRLALEAAVEHTMPEAAE